MTDFRALCAELAEQLDGATDPDDLGIRAARMTAQIRAALAQSEGDGLSDEAPYEDAPVWYGSRDAAAWQAGRQKGWLVALARWGNSAAPAPKPIPVSERPWERDGWRDTEGRCWFCNAYSMGRWNYQLPPDSEQDWGMLGTETHCLPHWAIARPRPEAKG
jgi:hypothetical protein